MLTWINERIADLGFVVVSCSKKASISSLSGAVIAVAAPDCALFGMLLVDCARLGGTGVLWFSELNCSNWCWIYQLIQ